MSALTILIEKLTAIETTNDIENGNIKDSMITITKEINNQAR